MIAAILRGAFHAGEIAARSGFRHGDRKDLLASNAGWEPSRLLLVVAQLADVGSDQAGMQLQVKARLAVLHILFENNLLVTEVGPPGPAVLLVGPHEQVALACGLGERPSIDEALRAPGFRVRRDLLLEKTPHGSAKLVVLGFKDQAAHRVSLKPGRTPRRGPPVR